MNWSEMALALLGSGIAGGIFGSIVNHILNLRFSRQSELLAKKREIFDEIAQGMRLFVEGALSDPHEKEKFLRDYSRLWLWAPDRILAALNRYMELNRRQSAGESVEQREVKDAYAGAILAMRQEIGFADTELTVDDYQFVKF